MNEGDASCGTLTWFRYDVDLSPYADASIHTITMEMTEAGTNGSNSNFFVDEITLESCETSCMTNRYVPGPISSGFYNASIEVNSDRAITAMPAQFVTFQAGEYIDLNIGFEVLFGSEFTAIIGPCLTPPSSLVPDNKMPIINEKSLSKNISDVNIVQRIKQQKIETKAKYKNTPSQVSLLQKSQNIIKKSFNK